jgi:hypothetical protein
MQINSYSMCGCGNPIPQERRALGFKYCVQCAERMNKPKMRGRMVYEHKTGGYIEVMSAESYNDNKKYFTRKANRSILKQV